MWIELHDSTVDHPKIIKVARDLQIPRVQALGHIISLWLWTLRMAPDGDLSSFDVDDIEIGCQWEGDASTLVKSMTKRGLLDKTPGGLVVHDWPEYATHLKAAERKRKQRKRTKEFRERNAVSRDTLLHEEPVTGCHSDRPTDRPTDRTDRPTDVELASTSQTKPTTIGIHLIDQVITHYQMHHPRARPGDKERKKIRERLKEGYSVEDLCKAIDGCHVTPHNTGQTNGSTYLKLELIVRDSGQVTRFMENADRHAPGSINSMTLTDTTRHNLQAAKEFLERPRDGE